MPTHNGIWLGAMLILSGLLPVPSHSTLNGLTTANASPSPSPGAPPLFSPSQDGRKTNKKRSAPISIPIHKRSSRARGNKRADEGKLGVVEIARAVLEHDARRMRNFLRGGVEVEEVGSAGGKGKNKRAGWETLPISSYNGDAFYFASVQIGTPPQTIDMLLDTGSTDLWVASYGCQNCSQAPYYDGSNTTFISGSSTTFQRTSRTARLSYADGSQISGSVSTDTIGLGSYTVPNQTFILATTVPADIGIGGLLGLAFPSLSRTNSTPWWLNALDQFEQPEMGFFLTEWNNPSSYIAPGGQFTLGGRNSSLYDGDIQFIPITSEQWWTIPIRSMILSNNPSPSTSTAPSTTPTTLTFPNQNAVIDTGTTLFYGPKTTVDTFHAAIPGAIRASTVDPRGEGFYAIPCASTFTAKIQFTDTVSMVFPATNIMWQSFEDYIPGYCISSFVATTALSGFSSRFIGPDHNSEDDPNSLAPSAPAWLIGDAFLKSVYTVFRKGNGTLADPPSVGFAPIKGVNYLADGNAIIGVGGDGVYGGIGNAGGPVITGGGGGGGGGGGATPTPSNVGAAQTSVGGNTSGTVYVTVGAAGRRWDGRGLMGKGLMGVVGVLWAVW